MTKRLFLHIDTLFFSIAFLYIKVHQIITYFFSAIMPAMNRL